MSDWKFFTGRRKASDRLTRLPPPPPWRDFEKRYKRKNEQGDPRGDTYVPRPLEIEMVNAALLLRRPLFIKGPPGSGKSSLAYAVASELMLGPVLHWPINSRSSLVEGLYRYDALGRLQELQEREKGVRNIGDPQDLGRYLRLGPLGTALLPSRLPRVLLIDEIDKADIDLPNDLLHVFEEGEYEIPELSRISVTAADVSVMPHGGRSEGDRVMVSNGRVHCTEFPLVILTSNEEREMPPAFLRRCLNLTVENPQKDELLQIVKSHLGSDLPEAVNLLLNNFLKSRDEDRNLLATDQLLNAIFLVMYGQIPATDERERILKLVFTKLNH